MADAIFSIVEGDGEREAVGGLLRAIIYRLGHYDLTIHNPINAHGRDNILKESGLERFLSYTRTEVDCKGVLVLLDAERSYVDCPPALAFSLAERARSLGLPFPVAVVCAVCEYESWFLYSLTAIAPRFELSLSLYEGDPEQQCNAKGWLTEHMPRGRIYKETIDQTGMTALIDIEATFEKSRSFRRLHHAVEELLAAIDNGSRAVTPHQG